MKEEYRDIKGYEGLYQISNLGRVKSLGNNKSKKEKILSDYPSTGGYLQVILCKNNKKKPFSIHRLVAQAFIPNVNNYPQVNHKDEDKTNNKVGNLEWCTQQYNNTYGTRIKRASEKISQNRADFSGSKHPRARKIQCITTGKVFNCVKEAAEYYSINRVDISKCCQGRRNYCGKHPDTGEKLVWKYID